MRDKLGVQKQLLAVENVRGGISKKSLIHNDATPDIRVDPETYAVTADGELLLFASTGPVNSAIVNSVRPDQRVAAVALSIFTIHLLGDVPSPPLIGLIADQTHSLAKGVLIVPVAVLVAGVVFTYAAWRGERDDRRGTA